MKTKLEQLLIENRPKLFNFAVSLTKDKDSARDLLSDTCLLVLKNQHKYNEKEVVISFIYTVMRNSFINEYRKTKRRPQISGIPLVGCEELAMINVVGFNDGYDSIVLDDIVKQVNKLPKRLSAPMMLFYSGYKYDEIAEMLNVNPGTIKSRIHIARTKLQETIVR